MASSWIWAWVAIAASCSIGLVIRYHFSSKKQTTFSPDQKRVQPISAEAARLSESLVAALPKSTVLPHHLESFYKTVQGNWAQQECEALPACIVKPVNTSELSAAVKIIKNEFDGCEKLGKGGLFSVRSGGHSPSAGASNSNGGILIDMSNFCEVTLNEDRSSVVIGSGAKWDDVSKAMEKEGLLVVGGRASGVGVGGLTLGGGISYLTPRYGLVCSNIISYEVVTASGAIITASATTNADLWRALKGGSNNFGIVTRFTAKCYPSTGKVWGGYILAPIFQAKSVLNTFHELTAGLKPHSPTTKGYDTYAAGSLVCFGYIEMIRSSMIFLNLAYTKAPETRSGWPHPFQKFSFPSMWRFYSNCRVRTLTSLTDDMLVWNPWGIRRRFVTTTTTNDAATIAYAYQVHQEGAAAFKPHRIKGLIFSLVLQPLSPVWARIGDPSPLGLDKGSDDPLVIVSFTMAWEDGAYDEVVKQTMRDAIEKIERYAGANKTGHPFRYLNYTAEWQRPFEGYGEENHRFLKAVSRKYDPDGLFQRGCVGGFKLGMGEEDEKA